MKRTDFLKTLGALIISPLAINSILKDKGCPPKKQLTEDDKKTVIAIDIANIPNDVSPSVIIDNYKLHGICYYDRGLVRHYVPFKEIKENIYEPHQRTIPARMS